MTDEMSFDEDNNAWLLTLPEIGSGARHLPACTVVAIRTLKDRFFPEKGDEEGKRQLTGRTCSLSLSCRNGGRQHEMQYIAEFTVNICDGTTTLDLTNSDFLIDYNLRGRGLGSWVMQQLICWARTLPADTRIKPIKTSPVDEEEKENMLRRDTFWHGIGFRFRENERLSLPLRIRDLQLPRSRHSPLQAVPLHQGVDALVRTCEKQKREIDNLESTRTRQADRILFLTERQWDVLFMKGLLSVLLSPLLLAGWLYGKVTAKKTDGQA
jgi:GNAT superfamily N-acetyltransferase